MVSARRGPKFPQVMQENAPFGDGGKESGLKREGPSSFKTPGPKSGASRKASSKRKGKRTKIYRNADRLSKLPDMPLDVLYEIFSLVCPVDLLRVSWVNKTFRSVLTNKSSRQVWVSAFSNIRAAWRPPPCPDDLTEIMYASLLYNPCCMDCGSPCDPVHWMGRMRVCKWCIQDWVTAVGGVQDQIAATLSRGKLYSSSQVLPIAYVKILPHPRNAHVFTKDLEKLTADLEATCDEAAVVQRYKNTLVVKGKFVQALELLGRTETMEGGPRLRAICDERIDQILERLADKGWHKEILRHGNDYAESIAKVKGVKVAEPLTQTAWEEMEARVLYAMRACKRRIDGEALQARCISRANKMRAIVDKYRQTLHPHDFCLWRENVWRIPALRKVITDGTNEVFNTCVEEVSSGFPRPSSQFLEELTAKISALLPSI